MKRNVTRQMKKLRRLQANAPQHERFALSAAATFGDLQADGKPNAKPTFSILAYSGGPINVGFGRPVVIDVSGVRANQATPILLDHDPARIVGQSTSVQIMDGQIRLDGRVMGEEDASKRVASLARDGFQWQASVGMSVSRYESIGADQSIKVNGREFSGPLLVARAARLGEVSFVAVGADENATAKVAASAVGDTAMTFEQWLKAKNLDGLTLTDAARASLKAMYDAEIAAADPGDENDGRGKSPKKVSAANQPENEADPVVAIRASAVAETNRITKITELFGDKHGAIRAKCIADGTSFEASENQFLKAENEAIKAARPTVTTGGSSGGRLADMSPAIEASLCRQLGLRDVEKVFKPEVLEASDKVRRIGLQEVLIRAAAENGWQPDGHRVNDGNIRQVLKAAFSYASISNILANVQNKILREAYMAVEQSWRRIAEIKPCTDFKAVPSYRLTGDLAYKALTQGGEIQHGTLGDIAYTNQADTYGRMLAITRKDIINDDLGALQDIPRMLGRGGALKLNSVFWTAFLDHSSFFSTGNANKTTGGTSALSSTSLATVYAKQMKQTDANSNPLGAMPRLLLVPPELEITALELMTSTGVNTGGAATDAKVPNRNIWAGKFEPVVSSYLSSTAITGNSATAWYLLCDPRDIPVIQVLFLNGNEMPIVESADADFETLGIQVRGYHDFGVAKVDFRGGQMSAGA